MADEQNVKTEKKTDVKQQEHERSGEDFQERVNKLSAKVGEAIKKGSQRVAKFTGSATRLSKLKVDIHNLHNQVEKVHLENGQKLWQLHHNKKLGEIDNNFSDEFKKIEDLEKQIKTKEKEAEAISLVE